MEGFETGAGFAYQCSGVLTLISSWLIPMNLVHMVHPFSVYFISVLA